LFSTKDGDTVYDGSENDPEYVNDLFQQMKENMLNMQECSSDNDEDDDRAPPIQDHDMYAMEVRIPALSNVFM